MPNKPPKKPQHRRPPPPFKRTSQSPVSARESAAPGATRQRADATRFPPAWLWLVDEEIPSFVKQAYSPRDSWKTKPFGKEDAAFFFRGIDDLSDLFTEERPKGMPPYFLHPKFRSAYLLYWLPLQAAKFLMLFDRHSGAMDAALEHAQKTGTLRVADLGSGPGTASLALLLRLLTLPAEKIPPRIELYWCDTQAGSLADGKRLAEQLGTHFPKLRGKIHVVTEVTPWWKAIASLPDELSLVLMGHVLNEAPGPHWDHDSRPWVEIWSNLWSKAKGGGLLVVEPAARRSSQFLSQLRDQLLDREVVRRDPSSLWGPCLHAEACPLAEGRDWCHFSIPAEIPGKWFRQFSKGLGSERQWLKFSYLWFAATESPAPVAAKDLRRVVSDPIGGDLRTGGGEVLLCEPTQPGRLRLTPRDRIGRGDLVKARKP